MKKITRSQWLQVFLLFLLMVPNLVVFLQVRSFQFVDFDDYVYVVQNSHVQSITRENFLWALTTQYAANWHPVTWLSHMADYHFFGAAPGGHHSINLLFHSLNSVALALLLLRLTGALWQSFSIALLFAIHPLHVESVAWVSERKDLLCTLFGFLSIYFFSLFAENKKRVDYLVSLIFFSLSLLSKPMLVTLPFLLLLLDFWPLGRTVGRGGAGGYGRAGLGQLLVEKLSFFLLALFSCIITFIVQKNGGAVSTLEIVSPGSRVVNAVASYTGYLSKSVWPLNLSVFYPYQKYEAGWPFSFTVSLLLLICFTLISIKYLKKKPYLAVGWFWFVGTLVPVIGIIQVGGQSMADRYMYVPLVGLLIVAVFGVSDILFYLKRRKVGGATILLLVTLCFTALSYKQASYWTESQTLFERAVRVTSGNYMAHTRLGVALSLKGRIEEALEHYAEAVRIRPEYVTAHYDMAVDLTELGRIGEAVREFETVIRLSPSHFSALMRLGDIYRAQGMVNDAARLYLRAQKLRPMSPDIYNTLGIMYAKAGEMNKAEGVLSQGVLQHSANPEIRNNLGLVYYYLGKNVPALSQLQVAIDLKRDYPEAHKNLGLALIRARDPETAIKHFREALRLRPGYPGVAQNIKKAERAIENGGGGTPGE